MRQTFRYFYGVFLERISEGSKTCPEHGKQYPRGSCSRLNKKDKGGGGGGLRAHVHFSLCMAPQAKSLMLPSRPTTMNGLFLSYEME